ncbi:hypothetical protein LguiB_017251 [Lonicera macranthoides]
MCDYLSSGFLHSYGDIFLAMLYGGMLPTVIRPGALGLKSPKPPGGQQVFSCLEPATEIPYYDLDPMSLEGGHAHVMNVHGLIFWRGGQAHGIQESEESNGRNGIGDVLVALIRTHFCHVLVLPGSHGISSGMARIWSVVTSDVDEPTFSPYIKD